MVSNELRDRTAKNAILGDKIVNYVLKYFFWGAKGITVDEIIIKVAKMKLQNLYDINEEIEESIILPDDIEDSTKAITTGSYQELDRMIEEYRQEGIEIEKLKNSVSPVPDYLQRLIAVGLVYPPDGRRVIGKLSDVAEFLVDVLKMELTWRFLKETFLQDDGSEWGDGTVTLALKKANSIRKE